MPAKKTQTFNIRPPGEMREPSNSRIARRRLRDSEGVLSSLPLANNRQSRVDAMLGEIAEWVDRYLVATTGKSRFPSNGEQEQSRDKLETGTRRLLEAMNADRATRMRIYHYLSDHSKLPDRPPKRHKDSLKFGRKLYRKLESEIHELRVAAEKSERMEDPRDFADPHVYLIYRLGRIWCKATGLKLTTSKLRDFEEANKPYQINQSRAEKKAKVPTARKFIRAVLDAAHAGAYDQEEKKALDDIRDNVDGDNSRLDHAMRTAYVEFYKKDPPKPAVNRYPRDRRRSDNDIKSMSDRK